MAGFLKWRLAAALILWVATIMAVAELRTDQSTGTVVVAFILEW